MTDTDRINFLQKIMVDEGDYTGKCVLRKSTRGKGYRLHETRWVGAVPDVRHAIDLMISELEASEDLAIK